CVAFLRTWPRRRDILRADRSVPHLVFSFDEVQNFYSQNGYTWPARPREWFDEAPENHGVLLRRRGEDYSHRINTVNACLETLFKTVVRQAGREVALLESCQKVRTRFQASVRVSWEQLQDSNDDYVQGVLTGAWPPLTGIEFKSCCDEGYSGN